MVYVAQLAVCFLHGKTGRVPGQIHSPGAYMLCGRVLVGISFRRIRDDQSHHHLPLQVVLNYQLKSTRGWNVWNVLLDFEGGLLSLVQMLIDSSVCGVRVLPKPSNYFGLMLR